MNTARSPCLRPRWSGFIWTPIGPDSPLELRTNRNAKARLIIGERQALVMNPKGRAGKGVIIDRKPELNRYQTALRRLLPRFRSAATMERVVAQVRLSKQHSQAELKELLDNLSWLRDRAEQAAWAHWKQLSMAQQHCHWSKQIPRKNRALARLVAAWDEAFAKLVFETLVQESLTNELSVGHTLCYEPISEEDTEGMACYRCKTPADRTLFPLA